MNILYVIIAHQHPSHLCKLIKQLSTPEVSFIVHIDKKSECRYFEDKINKELNLSAKIYFPERVTCAWGDFSLIQATLNCLKKAKEENIDYDYALLLSGQDYPLKSNRYISDFFKYSEGVLYMEIFDEDSCTKAWQKSVFDFRLKYRHLRVGNEWYFFDDNSMLCSHNFEKKDSNLTKLKNRSDKKTISMRILPNKMKAWGGSQWWALTKDVIDYILDFVEKNPDYMTFYEEVFIPDESFFQTIIMNHEEFSQRVINHRLRFLDWSKEPKPMVLNDEYLLEFEDTCRYKPFLMFARKFEPEVSENLLLKIDELIN